MRQEPNQVLVFDRAGIRAADQETIQSHGIAGIDLMERAAQGVVDLAQAMVPAGARVLICCGSGNNGGDGWAMARLLHAQGCAVHVLSSRPARADTDAAVNEQRARLLPIQLHATPDACPEADLLVDALLGTGLDSDVRGDALACIDWMNARQEPLLAVDIPSGLDANTGRPRPIAVHATATATFVGLKLGMLQAGAAQITGPCHVVDIGIPDHVAQAHSIDRLDSVEWCAPMRD